LSTYADSSFLVSIYVQDAHSDTADQHMMKLPSVWLTPFHRTELAHAIYLHVFYKKISRSDAGLLWDDFEFDCRRGVWKPAGLPEHAWETAVQLVRQYGPTLGVRTLDTLHVACALELHAERFWTFDARQARLAKAVGLDLDA
jgi:predicted nucleic acid-binding protein